VLPTYGSGSPGVPQSRHPQNFQILTSVIEEIRTARSQQFHLRSARFSAAPPTSLPRQPFELSEGRHQIFSWDLRLGYGARVLGDRIQRHLPAGVIAQHRSPLRTVSATGLHACFPASTCHSPCFTKKRIPVVVVRVGVKNQWCLCAVGSAIEKRRVGSTPIHGVAENANKMGGLEGFGPKFT